LPVVLLLLLLFTCVTCRHATIFIVFGGVQVVVAAEGDFDFGHWEGTASFALRTAGPHLLADFLQPKRKEKKIIAKGKGKGILKRKEDIKSSRS